MESQYKESYETAICSCGHHYYSGLIDCPMCEADKYFEEMNKEPVGSHKGE